MLKRKTEQKIVVVVRETRVQKLKKRFNTTEQAKFYVEHRGGKFSDYLAEDQRYRKIVAGAEGLLQGWGRVQVIDRSFLPNFVFGPADTVIAIGQDGLVANTLKYLLEGQPLIGVNPDPARWDGALLPFRLDDLRLLVPEVLRRERPTHPITMGCATLNDGQQILAVNDFFIGQRGHQSARYIIESGGCKERHSSSGVVVSTPLGSSGWLKSLLHGATSIANRCTGSRLCVPDELQSIPWDAEQLLFTVREPFPSRSSQAELVFGEVSSGSPLSIRSLMPEDGVIFSDGIESDFIGFNSGARATIDIAGMRGNLVV